MSSALPAVLGGHPAFAEGLPLVRPTLADPTSIARRIADQLASGVLTNGPTVRELEQRVAERLGVTDAVAVSSCTAGLMLTYQALGVTSEHRVVLPSFTFSASAHAPTWAGAHVDFCEVTDERGSLDVADLAARLDEPWPVGAVSATHLYGHPAEVERIDALAAERGVPVVYDAAHALGSERSSQPIGGFGTAEVFSLSPTKVVVAGEGGLVTTNHADLAAAIRLGRDYGNPGSYDCLFPGLNARMSELHAAVALASLAQLDANLERRQALVDAYVSALESLPGLRVIAQREGDRSTHKDLTMDIDEAEYGLSATDLVRALAAEGIDCRRYYAPPIHRQEAYRNRRRDDRALPVTDSLADRVLTPPLWSHLPQSAVERVAESIALVHEHAPRVAAALQARRGDR